MPCGRLFGVLLLAVAAQLAHRARSAGDALPWFVVRRVVARLGGVLVAGGVAALVVSMAGAARKPATEATAAAVRILVLGQPPVAAAEVVGPPSASTDVTGFSYPDDGSIVKVGSATGSIATQPGASASAEALTSTLAITLFGGEIAVGSVATHATAAAGTVTATADTSSSQIQGLVVLGQDTPATTTAPIPLADWGTLELLVATNTTETADKAPKHAEANVIGMRLKLLADHGGLPAGSEIDIGVSRASAVEGPEAEPTAANDAAGLEAGPADRARRASRAPHRRAGQLGVGRAVGSRPSGSRRTSRRRSRRKGYVFPVYGPASFGDSFGAPRPDLVSGWHHGEDIFAPLGTPLLAVADGVVHTVGWNEIGGWRLWLRDGDGQPVLLRASLGVLAARGRGQAGACR